VRQAIEGALERCDIYPDDAVGGVFELWDVAGLASGASNNVNTGNVLTNAYLVAEQAANRAKCVWTVGFKGDTGLTTKTLATRVPFRYGLAGRFVDITAAPGTNSIIINILAAGGFRVVNIAG
jgi:hypothetical protein